MSQIQGYEGGFRAWSVVFAGLSVITIIAGIRRSMGLFFLEITQISDAPQSSISLIVSIYFSSSLAGALVAVLIVRKVGTRAVVIGGGLLSSIGLFCAAFVQTAELFILFIGLLMGCGHSCLYVPTMVLVSQHFKKRRTLAVGICGSGGALGAFLVPPLIAFTADWFAAPGMLMIMAGINLNVLVGATFMKPPIQIDQNGIDLDHQKEELPMVQVVQVDENVEQKDNKSFETKDTKLLSFCEHETKSLSSTLDCHCENKYELSATLMTSSDMGSGATLNQNIADHNEESIKPKALWRRRKFFEVTVAAAFITFGQAMSFLMIPLLAEDLGINRYHQSLLLLLSGGADFIFRFITGLTADRLPNHRIVLFCCVSTASAVNWAIAANDTGPAGVYCFSLIQGTLGSAYVTLSVTLIIDVVGLQCLDLALSARCIIQAILLLVSPPFMAVIHDSFGSWRNNCWIVPILTSVAISILARHAYIQIKGKKLTDRPNS